MEQAVNHAPQALSSTQPNNAGSEAYPAHAQEWIELYQNSVEGDGMHEHTQATLELMGVDTAQLGKTPGGAADPQDFLMTDINDIDPADPALITSPEPAPQTPEEVTPSTEVTPITSTPGGALDWNARPVGKLSDNQADQLGAEVVNRLQEDLGLTKNQAAGVVGNLYYESAGMNPHVNEFGYYEGSNPYGEPSTNVYGYGWAQWTGARKQPFIDFAAANGLEVGSPEHNYRFLVHELQNEESASLVHLKQQGTPEDAARSFRTEFERAAFPNDGPRLEHAARFAAMA